MKERGTTLVMAGAREAHGIVSGLVQQGRKVVASLPEPERMFDPMPVPTRTGPFQSLAEFTDWLRDNDVSKIVDASHAFDAEVSEMARDAGIATALPYLRVMRPPWIATEAENWTEVSSIREAVEAVPINARLFSNTGWLSLPSYEGFRGARVFLRQNHEPRNEPPYGFVTIVPGEPPFTVAEEVALFSELRITHLICRNVGGDASASKLVAARELQLPVYMVARAPFPRGFGLVETVEQALEWELAQ